MRPFSKYQGRCRWARPRWGRTGPSERPRGLVLPDAVAGAVSGEGGLVPLVPASMEYWMPVTPTPGVKGQVLSLPALQFSRSMLSLAPATRRFSCRGLMATAGSFCLLPLKKSSTEPTVTSVSVAAAAGNVEKASVATTAMAVNAVREDRARARTLVLLPRAPGSEGSDTITSPSFWQPSPILGRSPPGRRRPGAGLLGPVVHWE